MLFLLSDCFNFSFGFFIIVQHLAPKEIQNETNISSQTESNQIQVMCDDNSSTSESVTHDQASNIDTRMYYFYSVEAPIFYIFSNLLIFRAKGNTK